MLSGARSHVVKRTQLTRETGSSPLPPLACCEHLGGSWRSSGPWFTSQQKWVLIRAWWGVEVTGELRGAHTQLLARRLALGSTIPPCSGLPWPCRPMGTCLSHLWGIAQKPRVGESPISAEGCNVYETGEVSMELIILKLRKCSGPTCIPWGTEVLAKGQGRV